MTQHPTLMDYLAAFCRLCRHADVLTRTVYAFCSGGPCSLHPYTIHRIGGLPVSVRDQYYTASGLHRDVIPSMDRMASRDSFPHYVLARSMTLIPAVTLRYTLRPL